MAKSYDRVVTEITQLNMKHGIQIMEKIMYDKFKKRRFDLLDARQAETLLDEMNSYINSNQQQFNLTR